MSSHTSVPNISLTAPIGFIVTTAVGTHIPHTGRHLLVFAEDRSGQLSYLVEPQVPSIEPYTRGHSEQPWREYDQLCGRASRIARALQGFTSRCKTEAWLAKSPADQCDEVRSYLGNWPEQADLAGCTIAICSEAQWPEISNSMCPHPGHCEKPHAFSDNELEQLRAGGPGEPVHLEWLGVNRPGGDWTLTIGSPQEGSTQSSPLASLRQRAVIRLLELVRNEAVHTWMRMSSTPASITDSFPHPFDLLRHTAQELMGRFPYTSSNELTCLGPSQSTGPVPKGQTSPSGLTCPATSRGPSKEESQSDATGESSASPGTASFPVSLPSRPGPPQIGKLKKVGHRFGAKFLHRGGGDKRNPDEDDSHGKGKGKGKEVKG